MNRISAKIFVLILYPIVIYALIQFIFSHKNDRSAILFYISPEQTTTTKEKRSNRRKLLAA